MKEAPGSSETSVLTRATRRNNPEDTTLHSHRRENLKSYNEYKCYFRESMVGIYFLESVVLVVEPPPDSQNVYLTSGEPQGLILERIILMISLHSSVVTWFCPITFLMSLIFDFVS
jgi:hypothetical protein